MPKLNSRQIVILSLMLLTVLYGAYDFFSNSRKKPQLTPTAGTSADLNAFITDFTAALSKDTPSPVDAYMMNKAEKPWVRDPFFVRSNDRDLLGAKEPAPGGAATVSPAVSSSKSQFNYTGYVEGAHKKIAIINGSEYAVGSTLDVEGFVLNDIFPNRIIIHNKETKRTLDVPLQE